jgi:hypothetical protein
MDGILLDNYLLKILVNALFVGGSVQAVLQTAMNLRCFVPFKLTFIESGTIVADLVYTLQFIAIRAMNSVLFAKICVVRDSAELVVHFQFT